MSASKIELPKYAWQINHPANHKGDLSATFYEEKTNRNGTITVNVQTDEAMFWFSTERGGKSESMFTGPELARVLEVGTALAKANGLVP